eukprot:NODE_15595_length_1041_cov_5.629103.p1 GENE.NODE_15595_length_1041_cov_5.629103~~NODE_15595_length_1041_cov_5.629103.p1  ORF type:complete len:322 (+),score=108.19 NODE_15595_length_1041_cov_5.629103:120-968(+)
MASESASAEASRMRSLFDGSRAELQVVKQALQIAELRWREINMLSPSFATTIEFMRDPSNPAAEVANLPPYTAGGAAPVRIPVLALRWRPGAGLNTTPIWTALRSGLFAIFHQLQVGALQPEDLELAVCCLDGRWYCTRDEEAPRFASLLMFQALHRDVPVVPTCRVSSPHAMRGVPRSELTDGVGLNVRSWGALWHTPPADEEDFLRALMRDSPFLEPFEALVLERQRGRVDEALRAEAVRDPVGSVVSVPPALRASSQRRPLSPTGSAGRPEYAATPPRR